MFREEVKGLEKEVATAEETITEKPGLKEKIERFKKYPKESLLVLSDFDHTFTSFMTKNTQCVSSYKVVERSSIVPKSFKETCDELANKYCKYERDTSTPYEERLKYIDYWYNAELLEIIKLGLNKKNFAECVDEAIEKGIFKVRYGLKEFIMILKKHKIPLVVLSAGLYQIVEMTLKKLLGIEEFESLVKSKLLVVVANRFLYNKDDVIVERKLPVIHCFNKREVTHLEIEKLGKEGGNFLAFGDHLYDIDMIENSKYNDVLGVAFDNNPSNKEDFLSKYDATINNDGDFTYINNILKDILKD